MSRRKKGFFDKRFMENQSVLLNIKKSLVLQSSLISQLSQNSYSSNKSSLVLDSFSCSSNKPGFVSLITNKGIDDNCLKGGFIIRK